MTMLLLFTEGTECDNVCQPACHQEKYQTTLSYGLMPSDHIAAEFAANYGREIGVTRYVKIKDKKFIGYC